MSLYRSMRRASNTETKALFGCALLAASLVSDPGSAYAQNQRSLSEAGIATQAQLEDVARDSQANLEAHQKRMEARLKEMEYQLEQVRSRIADIEQGRELEGRQRARESLNKRRTLNWPKVSTGMSRRQIYRLIGSGVKDKKETAIDCRCYSQGRICFDSSDLATKSGVRCQL